MPHLFGWCMDGHHEGCRFHYRDWYIPEKIYECSCKCHEGKKKPPLSEAHIPPVDSKSGRKKS